MSQYLSNIPFDPEQPTLSQVAVFGGDRLQALLLDPASPRTTGMLTRTVMALCTQYGDDSHNFGSNSRVLELPKRRFRLSQPQLTIEHRPSNASDDDSVAAHTALATVNNIQDGEAFMRPEGMRMGTYTFWENLFVHAESGDAFVERHLLHVSYVAPRFDDSNVAIKRATETEVAATLEHVHMYAAGDDIVRSQFVDAAMKKNRSFWRKK